MKTINVTQKGQVVIPKDLRDKYHIKANSPVMVTELDDHIAIIPVLADPSREAFGSIRFDQPVSEIMKEFHKEELEKEIRKIAESPKQRRRRVR